MDVVSNSFQAAQTTSKVSCHGGVTGKKGPIMPPCRICMLPGFETWRRLDASFTYINLAAWFVFFRSNAGPPGFIDCRASCSAALIFRRSSSLGEKLSGIKAASTRQVRMLFRMVINSSSSTSPSCRRKVDKMLRYFLADN